MAVWSATERARSSNAAQRTPSDCSSWPRNVDHGLLQGRAVTGERTAPAAHGKFVWPVKRIADASDTTRTPDDSSGAWSPAGKPEKKCRLAGCVTIAASAPIADAASRNRLRRSLTI